MKPATLIASAFLALPAVLATPAIGQEKLQVKELDYKARMINEIATVMYLDLARFPALEDPRNKLSKQEHQEAMTKHRNKALFYAFMVHLSRRDGPRATLDEIYKQGTTLLLEVMDPDGFRVYAKAEQRTMGMYFKDYDAANLDADLDKFLAAHTKNGKPAPPPAKENALKGGDPPVEPGKAEDVPEAEALPKPE